MQKKKTLLVFTAFISIFFWGTYAFKIHHINSTTNVNQHKHSIKSKVIVLNKSTFKNKLNNRNLSAVGDYNNIATVIYRFVTEDYFGYGWEQKPNGVTDVSFEQLWKIIYPTAGASYADPGSPATAANIAIALNALGLSAANDILNSEFANNWTSISPDQENWQGWLKDGSGFKLNLINQSKKIDIDATNFYNITTDNYFGYSIGGPTTDPIVPILFNSGTGNVNSRIDILNNLKKWQDSAVFYIKKYFANPGIINSSNNPDDLIGSWLKTELVNQNNKLDIDATSLFNITLNNYLGYSLDDSSNPAFALFFGANSAIPVVQSKTQIYNTLRTKHGAVASFLATYLKTPGTATTNLNDLVDGSWLKTELTSQNAKLTIDATSFFNLFDQNYFGYAISPSPDTDNSFFLSIFGKTNAPNLQPVSQIIVGWKTNISNHANMASWIATYLNVPGTPISDLNSLKDSPFKTLLNEQKTSLISSLTDSLTKFYSVFKTAFSRKNFNTNSFDGAQYVLLFFNNDGKGNLSLGTIPEVAQTFVNNLITTLKINPNFEFPNSSNKQLEMIKQNSIDRWISTLFSDNNGEITLTGDLANFSNFQKQATPNSKESNLDLILGITIPVGLITFGVGGYLIWKKIIQPKKTTIKSK